MDIISGIAAPFETVFSYALPFLFVLTVIVFFHELGHFMVARLCGVAVETFSVGFGKEICGFTDKKGTRWKLSWIPLGGYVKFLGDENAASVPSRERLSEMDSAARENSFYHKSVGRRSAVVAAGPIANFILAIVIFALMFMIVGRQITAAKVDKVQPNSAAATAGFEVGDTIVSIDGTVIEDFSGLQRVFSTSAGEQLSVVVRRSDELVTLLATPELREITDRFGNKHKMGVMGITRDTQGDVTTERYDPLTAAWMGTKETWFIVERTMSYLYDVIIGRQGADQLGGPLRIAQVSGQVLQISFAALFNLAAVLSISIGLINLFPIPMLDGGHLLYYGIEALRGKPLSEKMQDIGFRVGLGLVVALMVFATWNDLTHFNIF